MNPSFRPSIRHVRLGRHGVASIEFALIASLMVTLVLGTVDIGYAVWESMTLQQALRVGGQFALSWPNQVGTTGSIASSSSTQPPGTISAAIQQALPSGWTVNLTVAGPCSNAPADCDMSCGTATAPGGTYLTLYASRAYSALLVSSLTTNNACYVVRTQ